MSNPSKNLGLSLEDLQEIAQKRGIEDYEIMSRNELSSIIFPLKKVKKAKKVKNQKQVFLKQK